MEVRIVLVPSATKRYCRPCASFQINPISNFTALSHLWQQLILQIDQLESRCLVPKEGPLQRVTEYETFMLCPCYFFVLATPEAAQQVEEQLSVQISWICFFACTSWEYWITLQFYWQLVCFVLTTTATASLHFACKAAETCLHSPRRRLKESSGRDMAPYSIISTSLV